MRLQRVQVPNFRVLKDIDITFEQHRIPQIFPLASQNGGGKSTLLQLIFALLADGGDKAGLIENLLLNSERKIFINSSKLSTIELVDNGNLVKLDFEFYDNITLHDNFLVELNKNAEASQINKLRENGINRYSNIVDSLVNDTLRLEKEIEDHKQRLESEQRTNPLAPNMPRGVLQDILNNQSPGQLIESIKQRINSFQAKLQSLQREIELSRDLLSKAKTMLLSQGIHIIYSKDGMNLVCKSTSHNQDCDLIDSLKKTSEHVFMAAPSSQVFLFLPPEDLALLFKGTNEYYNALTKKQEAIKNLFLYEFSMVKVLTDAFGKAFENDRAQAIKSGGTYGTEFASLLDDLKNFFHGKTIQPSEDLSRIIIGQRDSNDQEVELNPIDLSHGELRRLAFYAWLKTNKIKNSIVLIDEIEIGMHPDWQYQIVRDLETWEPSNQYILATHSYEVCSALSPAHVKEIEPKLLKPELQKAQ